MFYVDSQRTTTRRDSSLITTARTSPDRESLLTIRGHSSLHFGSDHGNLATTVRPKGSVQKELVTLLFESMLKHIVVSWEVIEQEKPNSEIEKTISEVTVFSAKKKGKEQPPSKMTKSKINRSKSGLVPIEPVAFVPWWSGPDERAVIRFKNGNLYEGNISMKCMHGEGRFQWDDGTVYLGQFKDNEMVGKGMFQWKNDTWYEGEFACNLRHGRGLYVDSRTQGSYVGGWHLGTKHGVGALHYPGHCTNSYDGQWDHNVRHGVGSREYCHDSGYKGDWDAYTREGKGLMIWPNHDHSLITVASKLYAKTTFPGPKPDTILASAFRTFMDKDVLPGSVCHKGHLVNGSGVYMPLKALYALYRSLGEPHTVRTFLCAALRPHHDVEHPQPPMVEAPDECLPVGRNGYVFEDDMIFSLEDNIKKCPDEDSNGDTHLELFNFGNLSCKMIIKIFARIFPNVFGNNHVLNLDVQITFYEFFEAFICCAEESIRLKEELFKDAAAQTTFM
ncbi:uncharacterized protein LOC134740919 [Cydia strobilella]|uniref:uncharacterized protein LOC134740919 n=1 Tax=Cydia strobilella TaxID=1100964 RepID=UPI00300635B8